MRARWFTLALGLFGLESCTLLVDTSELDAGCGDGMKFCGRCVTLDDPAYGCDSGVCTPCEFPHAIPECLNGECVAKSCLYGYGCQSCTASILTEERNCGECGHVCADSERCVDGVCARVNE